MKIDILGTVGVPAKYGGFETLVENLIKYHYRISSTDCITVYCSSKSYPRRMPTFLSAKLRYLPLNANGAQSIPYDILACLSATWRRCDVILLLGVSGAIILPFIRLFSSVRVITNIDGVEWRREKWRGLSRRLLRFLEKVAVRYSHEVISDNDAIADYVKRTYGVDSHVIAYGGDHAVDVVAQPLSEYDLPMRYALTVCRIEPENNIHIILEACAKKSSIPLIVVGNWNDNEYGRRLRERYADIMHLHLLDPIYDQGKLKTLRGCACLYIHGHSAGGTNPSLVEAMHFGCPILAFDCAFNRATTEGKALFFSNSSELYDLIERFEVTDLVCVGQAMVEIARRRYTWDVIGKQYFQVMRGEECG